jgi:hypothetical protein
MKNLILGAIVALTIGLNFGAAAQSVPLTYDRTRFIVWDRNPVTLRYAYVQANYYPDGSQANLYCFDPGNLNCVWPSVDPGLLGAGGNIYTTTTLVNWSLAQMQAGFLEGETSDWVDPNNGSTFIQLRWRGDLSPSNFEVEVETYQCYCN